MDAEEAALLAELRAISNKSAASRFVEDDDEGNNNNNIDNAASSSPSLEQENRSPTTTAHSGKSLTSTNSSGSGSASPSSNDNNIINNNNIVDDNDEDDDDMLDELLGDDEVDADDEVFHDAVAGETPQKQPTGTSTTVGLVVNDPAETSFQQQPVPSTSTFSGERGGAAEDAELLALLRGVSAKSGAADRFATSSMEDDDEVEATTTITPQPTTSSMSAPSAAVPEPEPAPRKLSPRDKKEQPPWKRDQAFAQEQAARCNSRASSPTSTEEAPPQVEEESAVVVVSQQEEVLMAGGAGNFKTESSSTFQGERGGAAEDAELLALLRGVSAKSSGADRFADDGDDVGGANSMATENVVQAKPTATKAHTKDRGEVPPWKRKQQVASSASSTVDDVVVQVAAPKPALPVETEPALVEESSMEEAPPPPEVVMGGASNFKQESTFSGERGGAAEDAELLALLRGVSAKSSSADRFADEEDLSPAPAPLAPKSIPQLAKKKPAARTVVPPWKKDKAKAAAAGVPVETKDAVVVAALPAPAQAPPAEPVREEAIQGGRGNFKQESTFAGERGGSAEDEELLALLRGVSNKSSGADRFAEEGETPHAARPEPQKPAERAVPEFNNDAARFGGAGNFKQESNFQGERGGAAEDEELLALLRGVSAKSSSADRFAQGEATSPPAASPIKPIASMGAPTPVMSPAGQPEDEVEVTRDKLPESVTDSNWKVRRDSYILLAKIIVETSNGREPSGDLSGDLVLHGLDDQVAGYLMDKNAAALEEALLFAVTYVDYCQGGSSAELADTMAKNLIKGSGFTSPRPKASKAAEELVLKLMEVGNGTDSINAIVGVLLDQGLSSKKPKIVQMSTQLILEAAISFGAGCLPLAAIKESLPKILAHSNKKIRDIGLELVVELCRALGSKSALEDVMEQMKKPQIKDLDDLLEKQPNPTEIKIGLRCHRGSAGGSPEDALAALQAGAAELEAERFARRPAVDLPSELKKSEYSEHLKLAKWSEKVTGLKLILECGGEKPYKLMPPSSSVNYSPLIGEMKGVLSHTHFAVVSKALEVLSMLAEGAGEKLYPNLRPLLPNLFALSKDKKLTNAVSSCLDSFFGNALSFEHILDADAIPDATDEHKEKNALARTMALDFLARCVSRGESAGPRGVLEPANAKNAAQLSSEKLADSDASVRKAALNVLKTLQKVENPESQRAVQSVVAELETSQPRAFKQLGSVSVAPKPASVLRPSPASSPVKAKPLRKTSTTTTSAPSPKASTKKAVSASVARNAASPYKAPPRPSSFTSISDDFNLGANFTIEDATDYVASLGIPSWDAGEEDGGILAGLHCKYRGGSTVATVFSGSNAMLHSSTATKWLFRHNAIKAVATFINDRELPGSQEALQKDSAYILVLVKEHTRGFQETNVNVSKSIMELCIALCDCHEKEGCPMLTWAARDMATFSCSKISDKKLCPMSRALLISACVVQMPHLIIGQACATMAHIKSPVSHEEFLKWMKMFAVEFGAASIGPGLKDTIVFLSEVRRSVGDNSF